MPTTPHVIVISTPKSASTFVFKVVQGMGGFCPFNVLVSHPLDPAASLTVECDLTKADMIRASEVPLIAHQHLLPSPATLRFIETSGMYPIIIFRDIADAIVSQAEEFERQWWAAYQHVRQTGFSLQFCGPVPLAVVENFLASNTERRLDITLDLCLTFYHQFAAGWSTVLKDWPPGAVRVLDFQNIAYDGAATLIVLARDLGLEPPADIESLIAATRASPDVKFNIGHAGRGQKLLSQQQLARIENMRRTFAPNDFEREAISRVFKKIVLKTQSGDVAVAQAVETTLSRVP